MTVVRGALTAALACFGIHTANASVQPAARHPKLLLRQSRGSRTPIADCWLYMRETGGWRGEIDDSRMKSTAEREHSEKGEWRPTGRRLGESSG